MIRLGDLRYPLSPWPAHDIAEAGRSALANRWMLPFVGVIDMSDGLDWGRNFDTFENSCRLWLHSLPFVHDLVDTFAETGDLRYLEHARFVFLDHVRWSESGEEARRIAWTDEHAVANRCQVVIAFLFAIAARQGEADAEARAIAFESLRRHAAWLAEDSRYIRNNHGVMMDRALLSAALVLRDDPRSPGWRETALRRLAMMFEASFDEDGCGTENSPYYHQFNVDLFRAVQRFLIDHAIVAPIDFATRLAQAERVSAQLLRDDGTLPLIGDTLALPPAEPIPRRLESAAYPVGGFAVVNSPDLILTAKCGGATFVHRHIDDGSITLRYAGRDLVVDSGLYSYDMGDRVRRWFVSYRSHSGFYVEDCADVRFANYPNARALGRIRDFREDGDRVRISMEVTMVPGVLIEREIEVRHPDTVAIVDRLRADRPVKWRQQFILHPGCLPELLPGHVTVRRDDVRLEIVQERGRPEVAVEASRYSERFLVQEPTQCVVFRGEGSAVELVTTIRCFGGQPSAAPDAGPAVEAPADPDPAPRRSGTMTIGIPPGSWSSKGDGIRQTGVAEALRFACSLGNDHGYLQSHRGRFDRIGPGDGEAIPEGSAMATATIVLRTDGNPGKAGVVGVFLLQFGADGRRIGGGSTAHRLSPGKNTLAAPVALDPAARRFKIALRIAGYEGSLAILSASVAFAPG